MKDAKNNLKISCNIYIDKETPCLIIYLSGQIDTYNSIPFQNFLSSIIDRGFINIIFDFSGISYLSSTGIGSFIFIMKKISDKKGKLIISKINSKTYEIFRLLGFDRFFIFCNSTNDAIYKIVEKHKKDEKSPFTLIISCPYCGNKYKINTTGKYKCKKCSHDFIVYKNEKYEFKMS